MACPDIPPCSPPTGADDADIIAMLTCMTGRLNTLAQLYQDFVCANPDLNLFVEEAPIDGDQYARQDGEWAVISVSAQFWETDLAGGIGYTAGTNDGSQAVAVRDAGDNVTFSVADNGYLRATRLYLGPYNTYIDSTGHYLLLRPDQGAGLHVGDMGDSISAVQRNNIDTDGLFFGRALNGATVYVRAGVEESDKPTSLLHVIAGTAYPSAVTNVNGADLILDGGPGASSGSPGAVRIQSVGGPTAIGGLINAANLPNSDVGLSPGDLWRDDANGSVVKCVPPV